jgi:VanZ family protein
MTRKYRIIYWLPAIFWMIVIFAFSARPAVQTSTIDWQDFAVKKTAHFVEYAVLTVLFIYSIRRTTSLSLINSIIVALILSVVYAVSDEFHQSFVPGREPRIRDVFVDILGSLSASLFLYKNRSIDKDNYRV